MRLAWALTLAATLWAADPAADLLAAAAKGDVARIHYLLQHGAAIESPDKNGRTALMIAAQHGRADAVKALLSAGAKADARDDSGLSAYAIAMFEPAGHGEREATLELLPKPPRLHISAIAGWAPSGIVSSCFEQRERVLQRVGLMRPDEFLLRELQAFIKSSGRGMAELVSVDARNIQALRPEAAEGADGIVLIEIEPGAACSGSEDALTFQIDLQVFRASDRQLLLSKNLGVLKGMRATMASNSNQYQPVFESWIKPQAGPIYWAAVEALIRPLK